MLRSRVLSSGLELDLVEAAKVLRICDRIRRYITIYLRIIGFTSALSYTFELVKDSRYFSRPQPHLCGKKRVHTAVDAHFGSRSPIAEVLAMHRPFADRDRYTATNAPIICLRQPTPASALALAVFIGATCAHAWKVKSDHRKPKRCHRAWCHRIADNPCYQAWSQVLTGYC
eukprot:3972624-Pleurochrysis_carterae.AAC.1